jgi:hypothetical protein
MLLSSCTSKSSKNAEFRILLHQLTLKRDIKQPVIALRGCLNHVSNRSWRNCEVHNPHSIDMIEITS